MWSFVFRYFFQPLLLELLEHRQYRPGLLVAETHHPRFQNPLFHDAVCTALDLLQRHDPRRFVRVCRNLCAICNGPLSSGAQYQSDVCWIDFSRYRSWHDHPGLPVIIAATIVHEATHGQLRGLARGARKIREEAICHREEWRCFERLAHATGLDLPPQWLEEARRFDPSWHAEFYAKSRLVHVREYLQRISGRDGFWRWVRRELARNKLPL